MAVSLSKVRELTGNDAGMVSLVKGAKQAATVSLEKAGFTTGLTAEVAMVFDFSQSMEWDPFPRYSRGEVQAAAERVLALACQFDDDGSVPTFFFHNDAWHAGDMTLSNYQGFIDNAIRGKRMGGTSYQAAIDEVLTYYTLSRSGGGTRRRGLFGGGRSQSETPSTVHRQYPIYVAFFTDGEPQDPEPSEQAIREAASLPVFWQFIGLGQEFSFLEKMDDMGGREVDNADFFSANRLDQMGDEALFANLCDEFPGWVKTVQGKGWVS
jgi:hypothetical protein